MRRWRSLVATCLLATACSRLTFIRPNAGRGDSERVAPEYEFRDDERTTARMAVRDNLLMGQQRFRAGQFDKAEVRCPGRAQGRCKVRGCVHPAGPDRGDAAAAAQRPASTSEGGIVGPEGGRHAQQLWRMAVPATDVRRNRWPGSTARSPTGVTPRPLLRWPTPGHARARPGSTTASNATCARRSSLDPGNAVALDAMAEHQFRNGRYLDARAFSERRLGAAPADPSALLLASQIEDKLGDKVAAARYVQRLRTEFPQARTAQPGEGSSP